MKILKTDPKQRKKALYSCDRCKTKKRKCVREVINEDGSSAITLDMAYTCTECLRTKSLCHTTLGKRKQSTVVYERAPLPVDKPQVKDDTTSIEKYEVLLNIVQKIFPNLKSGSLRDLQSVAETVGAYTPEPSDEDVSIKTESMVEPFKFQGDFASPNIHSNIIECMKLSGFSRVSMERNIKKETSSDVHKAFLKEMPLVEWIPRIQADQLVEIFFQKINPVYNYLDQEEFLKSYELFWLLMKNNEFVSSSVLFLKTTEVCQVYLVMMLAQSYMWLSPNFHSNANIVDSKTITKYLMLINSIIPEAILKPSTPGIQMLLLLSSYFDINNAKESACVLIKLASSQAISLGLNKKATDGNDGGDFAEKLKNGGATLWWAIFASEVRLSNTMGRPSSIHVDDGNVEIPSDYQIPSYTIQSKYKYSDHTLYFSKYIELHKVLHSFLNFKVSLVKHASEGVNSPANIEKATNLKRDLNLWKASLPSFLKDPYGNKGIISNLNVSLHLLYYYYFINLGTPFLLITLKLVQNNTPIPKEDAIFSFTVSSITCSKHLYKIFKYQYDNSLLDGTTYSGIEVLYHGVMAIALGILIISHKNRDNTLDTKYLSSKYGIDFDGLWSLLCDIRDLNNQLRIGFKSMSTTCSTIEELLVDLESFLKDKNLLRSNSIFEEVNDIASFSTNSSSLNTHTPIEDFNSILNNFNLSNQGFFEHFELESPFTFPISTEY
ncbi:hypothetical protein CLIB1444_15S00254 [[Candida] jaroonii]|uniref:Uncharacterized protein n=1 Tax=[Candida] jaroonii TaxID=467808 RepID=A0ACA9YEP7_9ASCO|nr:hypothetical protein CLIB1444_15S00254 [[Candida] jaroonii]